MHNCAQYMAPTTDCTWYSPQRQVMLLNTKNATMCNRSHQYSAHCQLLQRLLVSIMYTALMG